MRQIKLTLAYDGTDYHGWQRQPGLRTVQAELERAIESVTTHPATTHAASRTDAGVHARGQVASFLTPSRLDPETIARALNALLPLDLRVLSAHEVPQAFHPTLDARSKRYRYMIDNAPVVDPFLRRFAWHIRPRLDAECMHAAAQVLIGRHDFRSFETEWPNRTSSVRTIIDLAVARHDHKILLEVQADGFLYNMVRAITGTLVLVGSGRRPQEFVAQALAAADRRQAGPTAPPQGLVLLAVDYDLPFSQTTPGKHAVDVLAYP
jgi:tRNA pseudouridine38-40 synthase